MAYDEDLANRIRELIAAETGVTEKKMFGGLAFLIGGNMAIAASGQGGALVRVDPAKSGSLIATTDARPFEMRGRSMQGWLRVDAEHLRTKRQLEKWVKLGTAYARAVGDLDLDLFAAQPVLDRLLVEGGLELRYRLAHLHGWLPPRDFQSRA